MLGLLFGLWLVALVGCTCQETESAGAGALASTPEPLGSAPGGLVSRSFELGPAGMAASAFELVPTFDGATLVWAAGEVTGELRQQHLARDGALKGKPTPILPGNPSRGKVVDIVGARLDAGLAVAWVEQLGTDARASALFYDGSTRPEVIDLGPAWYTSQAARGNIALAATRDYVLSFVRGRPEPCAEGQRECFGFSLKKLTPDGSHSARGLPLLVPVPCSQHSTLLSIVDGRWHYGVCTLTGDAPVTTVFSIQFQPEYAKAEPYLQGCRPLGLFEFDGAPHLSGDCAGRRRIVRVHAGAKDEHDLAAATLGCEAGKLTFGTRSESFPLAKLQPALEGFLPPPWVPAGARAVYTGRALLVVVREGQRLKLITHHCA